MSDRQLTQAHLDLKTVNAIQDIFSSRSRWAHGTIAQDEDGHNVDFDSPRAYRFCFVGAYSHVTRARADEIDLSRIFQCNSGDLINTNDQKGYEAVLECLDRAANRLSYMIATPK